MSVFNIKQEIYNAKTRQLPVLNRSSRLLLKLHSFPLLNKTKFIKNLLYDALKIPKSTHIGPGFYCTSGNLVLGENVSLFDTFILDYGKVIIGDRVSFSYKNIIITSTHDLLNFNNIITKPVTIGSDVWITTGVIILPGVTIGSNTIIGAGSVVTKDIPSGYFAAGNPCLPINKITFKR